jgi:hypothetical protein
MIIKGQKGTMKRDITVREGKVLSKDYCEYDRLSNR